MVFEDLGGQAEVDVAIGVGEEDVLLGDAALDEVVGNAGEDGAGHAWHIRLVRMEGGNSRKEYGNMRAVPMLKGFFLTENFRSESALAHGCRKIPINLGRELSRIKT